MVVGRDGSDARGGLRVDGAAAGNERARRVPLAVSGELFELEEQLRLCVAAFRARRALVSAEEARKAVAVCLAVEAALREEREVRLHLSRISWAMTVAAVPICTPLHHYDFATTRGHPRLSSAIGRHVDQRHGRAAVDELDRSMHKYSTSRSS